MSALIDLADNYTMADNFKGALVVLDHLGEENHPFQMVYGMPTHHTMVGVDYLKELYECTN